VFSLDEEKDRLVEKLAEQFSQGIIGMEEYERILEYINKVETRREISIIEKIMRENNTEERRPDGDRNDVTPPPEKKHLTVFSSATSYINPLDGYGGEYNCYFGENKIIVKNLPRGRTLLNIKSVFGETKIILAENVKITNKIIPVFSEIADRAVNRNEDGEDELPELYITGNVIFGEMKIIDEYNTQAWKRVGEKIIKKIIDKIGKM
jgi:hypothetical protein